MTDPDKTAPDNQARHDDQSIPALKPEIDLTPFEALDLRVGTITSAELNPKARKPALVLTIDFGPLGMHTSSAQLTENYGPEALIGRQIIAVMNFPARRVAGVKSEVLVLGALDPDRGTILLTPEQATQPGSPVA